MHGGTAVFVLPYVDDFIWIYGLVVLFVINTITFLFVSVKNPGYIEKNSYKSLIDLL